MTDYEDSIKFTIYGVIIAFATVTIYLTLSIVKNVNPSEEYASSYIWLLLIIGFMVFMIVDDRFKIHKRDIPEQTNKALTKKVNIE